MSAGRAVQPSPELTAEPTPQPSSVVAQTGSILEAEDAWEVAGAERVRTTGDPFPPSEQELDRESLLFEAGRLYGRNAVRERAALLDGSHPLHRLKRPAA